jgi:K+-sensing histidine kinase KdpD
MVAQLNKLPSSRKVAFLTASRHDEAALEAYLIKPVLVKSLLEEGVIAALQAAEPHVVVVPRLVARELEPAAHEIYQQRILALLEHGYTVETTFPIVAYDGVNDLLNPPIFWPTHAQLGGTFLRHQVGQYVLCDVSPQSILNRLARAVAELPPKQTGLPQAQGLNLANLHRLREFMLRLATAHAADITRQATLAPLTLLTDDPWSADAWRFSVRELTRCYAALALVGGLLAYGYFHGFLGLAGVALGLMGVILIASFNSNILTTLLGGVGATLLIAWLWSFSELGAVITPPLLPGDMLLILATVWACLLALKLRFRRERKQTVEESQTRALLRLVYDVGALRLPAEILDAALLNLHQSLGLLTQYLPLEDGQLNTPPKGISEFDFGRALEAVRTGTVQKPEAAGQHLWCPVLSGEEILAVLGVRHKHQQQSLADANYDFLAFIRTYCRLLGGALRRAQYDLERTEAGQLASRESLRSSLLASVSHDLKTPLVSIIGSLSMLNYVRDGLPEAERTELVDSALVEAERLHRIVHNVLEMAKLESGMHLSSRAAIDPIELLSLAGTRLRRTYPEMVMMMRDFSGNQLLLGDELLLSQVFTNLLENAAKYGLKTKPIDVRLQADHANQALMIEVTSQGNPLRAEDLPKIFDKFYRSEYTDSKAAGSGLGLAICKAIVEAHEGTIEATIVPGTPGGMSFRVILPAVQAEQTQNLRPLQPGEPDYAKQS